MSMQPPQEQLAPLSPELAHDTVEQGGLRHQRAFAAYLREAFDAPVEQDTPWETLLDVAAVKLADYSDHYLQDCPWEEPTLLAMRQPHRGFGLSLVSEDEANAVRAASQDRVRTWTLQRSASQRSRLYSVKQFGRHQDGQVTPYGYYLIQATYPHPAVSGEHKTVAYAIDQDPLSLESMGAPAASDPETAPILTDMLDALRNPQSAFSLTRHTLYGRPQLTREINITPDQYTALARLTNQLFNERSGRFVASGKHTANFRAATPGPNSEIFGAAFNGSDTLELEALIRLAESRITGIVNFALGTARVTLNQGESYETHYGAKAADAALGLLQRHLAHHAKGNLRPTTSGENYLFYSKALQDF